MELKFKCNNCGNEHILKNSVVYRCGCVLLSTDLILINKIIELEERINKIEVDNNKYNLLSSCKKTGKKMVK